MPDETLDKIDRLIINHIQSDFPVAPRPYAVLADRLNNQHGLNISENELTGRVAALKQKGYVRRIGAVFNARKLGYQSTLCAARVPTEALDGFTALVNASSRVTHNYIRSDDLNVWFTFTAVESWELVDFLEDLKKASGVVDIYVLDAEKLFKIKVDFHLAERP